MRTLVLALALLPLACGSSGSKKPKKEQELSKELHENGKVSIEAVRLPSGEVEVRQWDSEGRQMEVARYRAETDVSSPGWYEVPEEEDRRYLAAHRQDGSLFVERWWYDAWHVLREHGGPFPRAEASLSVQYHTLRVSCYGELAARINLDGDVPDKVAARTDSESLEFLAEDGSLQVPLSALPALKRSSKLTVELPGGKTVEWDLAGADKAIAKVEEVCGQ